MVVKAPEKKFRDVLSEISVNIKEIRQSPSFIWLLLWSIIFAGLLFGFTYQIHGQFKFFYTRPVVTSLRDEHYDTMELPRMTLCSGNWVNWTRFENEVSEDKAKWIQSHFLNHYVPEFDDDFEEYKKEYMASTNAEVNIQDIFTRFSLPCESMIGYCSSMLDEDDDCSCCRHVSKPFLYKGFNMYQDNHQCDWQIFLTDPDEDQAISDTNFFSFTTENRNEFVILKHRAEFSLSPPYGVCENRELKYFSTYTQTHCRIEQQLKHGVEACGCIPSSLMEHKAETINKNFTVCDPIVESKCWFDQLIRRYSEICSPACEENYYEIRQSTGRSMKPIPNISRSRALIFYERLVKTVVTDHEAMTFVDMISKIGSLLAFWLGFRFMTFLQFFYYLYWALKKLCLRDKSNTADSVVVLESKKPEFLAVETPRDSLTSQPLGRYQKMSFLSTTTPPPHPHSSPGAVSDPIGDVFFPPSPEKESKTLEAALDESIGEKNRNSTAIDKTPRLTIQHLESTSDIEDLEASTSESTPQQHKISTAPSSYTPNKKNSKKSKPRREKQAVSPPTKKIKKTTNSKRSKANNSSADKSQPAPWRV